ncbi:MAG TPA: hypothetical protein VKE70_22490 [Candidatus Solibacter sp.]|nr:hypothetical protein [Candidatus Solibacter sp.]
MKQVIASIRAAGATGIRDDGLNQQAAQDFFCFREGAWLDGVLGSHAHAHQVWRQRRKSADILGRHHDGHKF